jgi:hypothetical protein
MEQALADGQVVKSLDAGGLSAARLELEVVNKGADDVYLGQCGGVPQAKYRYLPGWCSHPASQTTVRLRAGERLSFFLTLKAVVPNYPVSDAVRFLAGDAPSIERMEWTTASSQVSFAVHSTECGAHVEDI